MVNRPGFDLLEQLRAFAKVLAHIAFSAIILVAGEGLRRLIGWTLADVPSREYVDALVNVLTIAAASITALGVAFMSMWVFLDDLYTDLKVRARYNAIVRSGQQLVARQRCSAGAAMNYYLLAYGVVAGSAIATLSTAAGVAEGAAIARGIAAGMGLFFGYPLGRGAARLILAVELRLLNSGLRRFESVAAQYSLAQSRAEMEEQRAPLLARTVVMSANVGVLFALSLPAFALQIVLAAVAGLPVEAYIVAALGSAAIAGLSLIGVFAIILYFRGRIEWLAFRLRVVNGAELIRRRGHAVERVLRLRAPEPRAA